MSPPGQLAAPPSGCAPFSACGRPAHRDQGSRGDPGPGRLSPRRRVLLPPRWRPRKGHALPRARPPAGPRLAPFPGPLANPAGSTQSLRRRQRCARHKSDSLGTRTRLLRYRLFILTVKDSRAGRRAPPLRSRPAVGAYSSAKSSCFVRPDGLAFGGGRELPKCGGSGPLAADGPHALPSRSPAHQARDASLVFTDRILAFVLFCLCGTGISMEKFSWSWRLNFAFFLKVSFPEAPNASPEKMDISWAACLSVRLRPPLPSYETHRGRDPVCLVYGGIRRPKLCSLLKNVCGMNG